MRKLNVIALALLMGGMLISFQNCSEDLGNRPANEQSQVLSNPAPLPTETPTPTPTPLPTTCLAGVYSVSGSWGAGAFTIPAVSGSGAFDGTYVNNPSGGFPLMGQVHEIEVGVKRLVDGISDERYKSGVFYASKEGKLSGDVVDQSTFFTALKNTTAQDNAYQAIHRFIS